MASIQVKSVPKSVHQRLRRLSKLSHRTIGEIVLEAVKRELSREEFITRLKTRASVDLGSSAAALLEEERRIREE
jgi:hypothetical protein